MKAEELRIGNILQYADDERVKVHLRGTNFVVSADDILFLSEQELKCDVVDYVNPINVTEELLLKCGFEYSCYGGLLLKSIWEKTDITLRISIRKGIIKSFLCENEIDLKYIHELQNIYYSITKEELEIKL